jgi:hypothetical protein
MLPKPDTRTGEAKPSSVSRSRQKQPAPTALRVTRTCAFDAGERCVVGIFSKQFQLFGRSYAPSGSAFRLLLSFASASKVTPLHISVGARLARLAEA